jgi:DNA-binding transcriptional ArsR family regulator
MMSVRDNPHGGGAVREFEVGPDDPGRFRFSASAIWEVMHAARTLRDPVQQPYHRPWLAGVDVTAVLAETPTLAALSPVSGYTPDFLTPPPDDRRRPDLRRDIDRLRATSAEEVASGLAESIAWAVTRRERADLVALAADPERTLARVADELDLAWQSLVAPWWPAIERLLQADVAHRGSQILTDGLEAAVNGLDRRVRWSGERVRIKGGENRRTALDGRGLLLIPSAFGWPRVICPDPPWPPAIAYPARGIGELWTQASRPPEVLGRLLGPHRARVLAGLDVPTTTTDLALALGLAAPSVSRHLAVLAGTGLVTSQREGRRVPYRRTALGTALVSGARDET